MAVVAAGNEGIDVSASGRDSSGYQYDGQYPAKFATVFPDCVLAVAAVDSQERLLSLSLQIQSDHGVCLLCYCCCWCELLHMQRVIHAYCGWHTALLTQ
jgi:hypothetical protein